MGKDNPSPILYNEGEFTVELDLESLNQKLDKLQEMQEKVDRKTKDAEYYRQMNHRLLNVIKVAFICFCICFCFVVFMAAMTFDRFSDKLLSGTVTTETVTSTEEMSTSSGGVLINGDNNTSTVENGRGVPETEVPNNEK